MASYNVDDKVSIAGKVLEIVENDDGKFYRLKVRHNDGSSVISIDEQYIHGLITSSNSSSSSSTSGGTTTGGTTTGGTTSGS